jgi:beta-phosphoglucomutase
MRDIDSILFDFDGVLLDTEPVHCACWAEVLAPLGVTLTWEFYRASCIGIDDRDMLRMMATQSDPPRDWNQLWAQYPAKKAVFRARMEKSPPFHDTLTALLAELNGRYPMGVVSSSGRDEIEPLLAAGGLRDYFRTIVGGGDVKKHKPEPEPYLLAAERLGVKNPLVLEDSQAGIASGRAAGFEVIAVPHPSEVADLLRARLDSQLSH